jgi:hypothetical protein
MVEFTSREEQDRLANSIFIFAVRLPRVASV